MLDHHHFSFPLQAHLWCEAGWHRANLNESFLQVGINPAEAVIDQPLCSQAPAKMNKDML